MMMKQIGWINDIAGKPTFFTEDPREVHYNGKPVYPVYREVKSGMKVRLPSEIGAGGMIGYINIVNEKEGWILTSFAGKAIQLRVEELELV